jgi:hypothetical protein
MEPKLLAFLFKTGGELASSAVQMALSKGFNSFQAVLEESPTATTNLASNAPVNTALQKKSDSDFSKPSTEETIQMLENRLNESLVALQPDLLDGARIFGKPCDCLKKHTDEMIAAVKELQSMSPKPVYSKIRNWAEGHNWGAEIVAQHPPEYFVKMTPELRTLRKELSGSEPLKSAMRIGLVKETPKLLNEPKPDMIKIRALAKRVKDGEITREEAVSQIKTMLSVKSCPACEEKKAAAVTEEKETT